MPWYNPWYHPLFWYPRPTTCYTTVYVSGGSAAPSQTVYDETQEYVQDQETPAEVLPSLYSEPVTINAYATFSYQQVYAFNRFLLKLYLGLHVLT